ncbi:MAG: alpha-glucuronidase, partial [Ignavibacteriae bacterium]|nr:alpha-glucuronidase [Ignavibacteriota bacterium]
MKFITILILFTLLTIQFIKAEDGYKLWLRYNIVSDPQLLDEYNDIIKNVKIEGSSETMHIIKNVLELGLTGLLGKDNIEYDNTKKNGLLVVGSLENLSNTFLLRIKDKVINLGEEGYLIFNEKIDGNITTVITGNTDIGVLYGTFQFLKLLQTNQNIKNISIESSPKINLRVLNHWDNLDRTVERGYAGFSIWDWHKLPDYIDQRYIDYARANSSIGINGTVLTNVNANSLVLTEQYLVKVKALADIFRPYGIKVYLTARFSSPIELGGLKTADPLNEDVKLWWKNKVDEIYKLIPNFGGFLVKANSEGQPGPQNYGRSHADGANMLADALSDYNGVVMWRAFVYSNENQDDRAKQAYTEFQPLDGKFRDNVFIQVKNGAIDFQPREPFHPLFGAMPKTPLMMEFQITQEYLGQGTQLAYLSPLYKECLDSDTYAKGKGSYVSKVIDGSLDNHAKSGIAGVANIGTDRNWTGHLFGQSNWYTFGRLAWDHELSSQE